MTWHDDLRRIADALETLARVAEDEAYPPIDTITPKERQDAVQRYMDAMSRGIVSVGDAVTPLWDTDEDQLADIEAENEVIEPVCTHHRQNLRSNGDVGCADCPQVIIPKTGFNATGGPNLEAK